MKREDNEYFPHGYDEDLIIDNSVCEMMHKFKHIKRFDYEYENYDD